MKGDGQPRCGRGKLSSVCVCVCVCRFVDGCMCEKGSRVMFLLHVKCQSLAFKKKGMFLTCVWLDVNIKGKKLAFQKMTLLMRPSVSSFITECAVCRAADSVDR